MKFFFSLLATISCCVVLFSKNTPEKKGTLHIFRSNFQNKSFITLSYTTPFEEASPNGKELKDFWKRFIFYSLLQDRLQQALSTQGIDYTYHQKGILNEPNSCTVSVSCPSHQVVDAISEICRQMEKIKLSGFLEKELQNAKEKAHYGLYKVDNYQTYDLIRLASNDMTNETTIMNLDSVIETSKNLIDLVSLNELIAYSQAQIIDANRQIDIVVPSEESFISENELAQILEEQKLPLLHKNTSCEGLVVLINEEVLPAASEEMKSSDNIQPQLEEISTDNAFPQEEGKSIDSPPPPTRFAHDYYHQLPITSEEKKMIAKIIYTMADNNVFKLLFEKKKLEKIGKKIHHVHPLKFLGTVFSDPTLVHHMRKIRESSFKWEGFMDGLAHRMVEESGRDNLRKYLPGFCAAINANLEVVTSYADRGDFEGLVISLL